MDSKSIQRLLFWKTKPEAVTGDVPCFYSYDQKIFRVICTIYRRDNPRTRKSSFSCFWCHISYENQWHSSISRWRKNFVLARSCNWVTSQRCLCFGCTRCHHWKALCQLYDRWEARDSSASARTLSLCPHPIMLLPSETNRHQICNKQS